ncbi:hypothetical protein AVO42_02070 [Thiomicrospira sp. XS5]|nr:hypothetical protein AVO42_02070 [Thiomicrospira sp. XS5]
MTVPFFKSVSALFKDERQFEPKPKPTPCLDLTNLALPESTGVIRGARKLIMRQLHGECIVKPISTGASLDTLAQGKQNDI